MCEILQAASHAIHRNYVSHYLIRKVLYVSSRGNYVRVNQSSIGCARWRKVSFLAKIVSFSYFICTHLMQTQHTSRCFVDLIEIYNKSKKKIAKQSKTHEMASILDLLDLGEGANDRVVLDGWFGTISYVTFAVLIRFWCNLDRKSPFDEIYRFLSTRMCLEKIGFLPFLGLVWGVGQGGIELVNFWLLHMWIFRATLSSSEERGVVGFDVGELKS